MPILLPRLPIIFLFPNFNGCGCPGESVLPTIISIKHHARAPHARLSRRCLPEDCPNRRADSISVGDGLAGLRIHAAKAGRGCGRGALGATCSRMACGCSSQGQITLDMVGWRWSFESELDQSERNEDHKANQDQFVTPTSTTMALLPLLLMLRTSLRKAWSATETKP